MTPLNEDWLKKNGFELIGKTMGVYRKEIKLPYEGVRFIECSLIPKGWIAYYMVNNIPGSRVMRHTEEIEALLKATCSS